MATNLSSRAVLGLVVSLAIVLAAPAARAQAPSIAVDDYVILAVDEVRLKNGAFVTGGGVGVVEAGGELRLGTGVTLDDGTEAVADRIGARRGASVCELFANAGSVRDLTVRCGGPHAWSPPLLTLPALPVFAPGTADVRVRRGETLVLPAGVYGRVKVANDAVLVLAGGTYEMARLIAGRRAEVRVEAPTILNVADGVRLRNQVAIRLAAGLDARDLRVNAGRRITLGASGVYAGDFFVPDGLLRFGRRGVFTGRFVGRRVGSDHSIVVFGLEARPTPTPSATTGTPAPTPSPTRSPTPSAGTPAPMPTPSATFTMVGAPATATPMRSPTPAPSQTVRSVNRPPAITSTPPTDGREEQPYAYDVEATDPEGGDVAFSLAAGPAGMTIDPGTGLIGWLPGAGVAGAHDVVVRAVDPLGLAAFQSFTIVVASVPAAPVAVDDGYEARTGETLAVAAPGVMANDTDANGDPLTAMRLSDPLHGTLDFRADGSFDYTPDVPMHGGICNATFVTDTNLSFALPDPLLVAPSENGGFIAPRAVDDDLQTSWLARDVVGEAFFEQVFREDVTVDEIRMFGNRSPANGNDFLSGTFRLFDAADVELFTSGEVALPAPDRDLVVPVGGVAGVRRVRFSSSSYEGNDPGFAELHVIGAGDVCVPNLALERQIVGPRQGEAQRASTQAIGDLDGDGTPEIVVRTNTAGIGNVRWTAYDGATGTSPWQIPAFPYPTGLAAPAEVYLSGVSSPALGDIDGDGRPEVLLPCASANQTLHELVLALEHDGTFKWLSESIDTTGGVGGGISNSGPAIADLDGDGDVEIVVGYEGNRITVFDHEGKVVFHAEGAGNLGSFTNVPPQTPIVADLDLDGRMEIFYGDDLYGADGTVEWSGDDTGNGGTPHYHAVANLDDDPYAEIVQVANSRVNVFQHDGARTVWPAASIEGPISIADIDGDGRPEVLGANQRVVQALEHDGTLKWEGRILRETLGTQGTTAFDFDGDGVMEVLYQDLDQLFVFDGRDGRTLARVPGGAGASAAEQVQPYVVDVDGDGQVEVVVGHLASINDAGILVYGPATGTWAETRPVWNQVGYHVTHVDPDGGIPAAPPPNWLVPGLNNFRVNVPLPEERTGARDSFTYKVDDGALDSNTATVHLEVLPAGNPPRILSQPPRVATVGFAYRYTVLAVDPDLGDVLTYALSSAPAGMAIDPASGLVIWTPMDADVGDHAVGVTVDDTLGFTAFQAYTLTVGVPVVVPDVVGRPQAAAEGDVVGAGLVVGPVSSRSDAVVPAGAVLAQAPAGGALAEGGAAVALVVSTGPAPEDVDDDGDGLSENAGDCDDGDATIVPGAADPSGDGIDQDCDGIDGTLPIAAIVVEPVAPRVLVGATVPLRATAVFEDGTSQVVTALVLWESLAPGTASVAATGIATALAPGDATIRATLGAVSGEASLTAVATVAGDAVLPVAAITAPGAGATITEPVDVIGTASDANFLRYELAIAPAGSAEFTTITLGAAPVVGGVVGVLDPTLLLNDQYELRLTVFDRGGHATVAAVTVLVDGAMKVGKFTLTFTDLSVPMAGLPIQVLRIYDSRDKGRGDFGIGWRLGVRSLACRASGVLGDGWLSAKSGLAFLLQPTTAHTVSLTLPGGRVEVFDLRITPSQSFLLPFSFATASFVPRAGTLGTLTSLDNNFLVVLDAQPGPVQLLDDSTFAVYDPDRFRYRGHDGSEIVLSKQDGVESFTDPNGNRLTFGPGGIVHSGGKSALFQRDGAGRVTRVTDPNGNAQTYTYGPEGDLRSHTDAEGHTSRFFYDRRHNLIRIEDPLGNRAVRNEYDDDGRLRATIDALGNRVEFAYDLGARQQTQTDPRGHTEVVQYDQEGRVTARQRVVTIEGVPTLALETFEYDGAGNETAVVNADGTRTEFTYDAAENPVQIVVDPGGLAITTSETFDGGGRPLTQTNALGKVTAFEYDARGNPVRVTNPRGQTTRLAYDAAGQVIEQEDAGGHRTLTEYTPTGQVARRRRFDVALGLLSDVALTYDANGNVLTRTQLEDVGGVPTPFATTYTYDRNDRVTSTLDPAGSLQRVEYDAAGQVRARIDGAGERTELVRDGRGLVVRIEQPDGSATRAEYDAAGNRTKAIDALDRETAFTYDELGRSVTTTFPNGSEEHTVFSPGGLRTARIDAEGHRTEFEYDADGRRTRTLAPEVEDARTGLMVRPEVREEYDAAGRRTAVVNPTGGRTEFAHDDLGRVTTLTLPDGETQTFAFDDANLLATRTDEAGNTTTYTYDAAGRVTAVTQPPAGVGEPAPVTAYEYDMLGRRVSETDALGRTTRFEYDPLGRLTSHVLPGGEVQVLGYDTAGNLTSFTDFNDRTFGLGYDAVGRLTTRTLPDGSMETATYTATGRRETITDARGTTAFAYDTLDRLASITQPDGQTVAYTYDANGNLETLTTNGIRTVTYEYDAANRLVRVAAPEGDTTFGYDPAGSRVEVVRPNGVVTTEAYDARNQLALITHRAPGGAVLASFAYTHAPTGVRETITEADGAVETFAYDDLGRLTSETRTGTDPRLVTYEYDLVGNRMRRVRDGVETLYSYDANDRLLAAGPATYTYDPAGNRLTRTVGAQTTLYDWDALDRLAEVVGPAGAADTTRYAYDVDGNRVRREAPGGTTAYLVDPRSLTGVSQVVEERDGGGAALASYTYGNELLALDRTGTQRFFQADALGSTRLLTDGTGAATDAYAYEAFGATTRHAGTDPGDRQFAGEALDGEADAYYLRARFYDPETGGFLSRDRVPGDDGVPASLHRYQYVRNNPANLTDPSGELDLSLAAQFVAQGIQNGLKRLDLQAKAAAFCRAQAGTQAVEFAITLGAVAVGALNTQIARTVSGDPFALGQGQVNKFAFEGLLPIRIGRKEFSKFAVELGLNNKSDRLLTTFSSFKFELEDEKKRKVGFEIAADKASVGLAGELVNAKLKTIQGCGVDVASLDFVVEGTVNTGVKADPKARFGSRGFTESEIKGFLKFNVGRQEGDERPGSRFGLGLEVASLFAVKGEGGKALQGELFGLPAPFVLGAFF